MLELCEASMVHLFPVNEPKYRGPMPHLKKDVLYQLAKGLEHIHSKQLIHRNIKPSKALIWVGYDKTGTTKQVLMKWADFGLLANKQINQQGDPFTKIADSGEMTADEITMTRKNWKAPELLKSRGKQSHTAKSDVYAEGLVFAYFLLDGKHPDDQFQNSNGCIIVNTQQGKTYYATCI